MDHAIGLISTTKLIHLKFMVDKMTFRQGFSSEHFGFYPVMIILTLLRTHSILYLIIIIIIIIIGSTAPGGAWPS